MSSVFCGTWTFLAHGHLVCPVACSVIDWAKSVMAWLSSMYANADQRQQANSDRNIRHSHWRPHWCGSSGLPGSEVIDRLLIQLCVRVCVPQVLIVQCGVNGNVPEADQTSGFSG